MQSEKKQLFWPNASKLPFAAKKISRVPNRYSLISNHYVRRSNILSINYNVQTTTTNNIGNNVTPEMKTYYDRQLIRFAQPKLVHAQFGQNKPIPKGSGKTIEFRRFSPLPKAMVPLTEGVTPKGNQINITTVESTFSSTATM